MARVGDSARRGCRGAAGSRQRRALNVPPRCGRARARGAREKGGTRARGARRRHPPPRVSRRAWRKMRRRARGRGAPAANDGGGAARSGRALHRRDRGSDAEVRRGDSHRVCAARSSVRGQTCRGDCRADWPTADPLAADFARDLSASRDGCRVPTIGPRKHARASTVGSAGAQTRGAALRSRHGRKAPRRLAPPLFLSRRDEPPSRGRVRPRR